MRAIEIFCCSGGMAEGFRRAGVRFDLAFDFDANACDSYERNLGHRPIQLDARDLLRIVRLSAAGSRLDLLVADPPCTPWSRAGKRKGLEDERDMLAVTAELIATLRPQTWLVGNVPGLDDSTNTTALQRTLGRLDGYCVDFARLDAADYGVPQHRVRPFWFGHPFGTPCLRWPHPTHADVARQTQIPGTELLPYVTVADALRHLTPRELGKPIRIRERASRHGHPPSVPDRPSMTIASAQASNGSAVVAYGCGDHRPSRSDRPSRTLTTNPYGDGALITNPRHPLHEPNAPARTLRASNGAGASNGRVATWPWDRPATTLTCRDEVAQYGRSGRLGQPQSANAVKLSERAGAILQGFPAGWHFAGSTKASRWAQIGMAMPPGLAHAVASQIVAWFAQSQSRLAAG